MYSLYLIILILCVKNPNVVKNAIELITLIILSCSFLYFEIMCQFVLEYFFRFNCVFNSIGIKNAICF